MADLRAGRFRLELAGIVAAIDAAAADALKKIDIPPVPRMAWVLIGIPTVKVWQDQCAGGKNLASGGVRIKTTASSAENGEEN